MKQLTLENIAAACHGTYMGDSSLKQKEIRGAVTDSRQVTTDYLFVPVKGERADGHDFIPQVFEQGALATLSEKELPDCPGPYILVESSLQALKDIAAYYRTSLTIPVIGITGSVGKTSTKEMIASVLSVKYNVLKTAGNFNNEIGLPLTLLRIQEEHQVAVVEMGISEFGEMHRLSQMARPDICVITNIGTCHLENLKDRDGVLKAKTEIFDFMKPGTMVVLNGDDDKLITISDAAGNVPVFYGMEPSCSIYMDQIENLGLKGTRARLHTPQGEIPVEVPIPGEHHLYNAMAAAGIGLKLGLTLSQVQQGIRQAQTISGRSNLIEANGRLILDDCYNANPMSMKAALDVLKNGQKRKVAILGDMGELGENEKQLHYEVGTYAAGAGIDLLICVGTLSEEMRRGAQDCGNDTVEILYYPTLEELLGELDRLVMPEDTILVKASHFMGFSQVIEALK